MGILANKFGSVFKQEEIGGDKLIKPLGEHKNILDGLKLKSRLGFAVVVYAIMSSASFMLMGTAAKTEEFNPKRRTEEVLLFNNKHANKAIEILFNACSYPWKKIGVVDEDRYLSVRSKAFEIAGIDENNPKGDLNRFNLQTNGFCCKENL